MKRLLSTLLAAALLTGLAAPAQAHWEGQIPQWAREEYERLERAYLYPSASGPISRGHFIDLLTGLLDAALPEERQRSREIPPEYFADNYASEYWAERMCRGAGYGITEGVVDDEGRRWGKFEDTLTRQEAAKMVCAALDAFAAGGYPLSPSEGETAYADEGDIAPWAAPFTGRVAAYGLMVGNEEGRFLPTRELDWPAAAVIAGRALARMETAVRASLPGVELKGEVDWTGVLDLADRSQAQPLTGYGKGYYTIDNGDGTLSGLVIPPAASTYQAGKLVEIPPAYFYVERYDGAGNGVEKKAVPFELPLFGGFLAGEDGSFYLAFGQEDPEEEDGKEVYRIVRYDKDWNRVAAASVTGGESRTTVPFRSAVARMALSPDGETLTLHAARQRYGDETGTRHQSNVTISVSTKEMRVLSVSGEVPENHVSHSFGQFVRYDGGEPVTVDQGDAYPRAFVLQGKWGRTELLALAGEPGENRTNAIGSGFETSDSGYLFLGCSAPQEDFETASWSPWNLFLSYVPREGKTAEVTWLTQGESDIRCARLVKLGEEDFLALWAQGEDLHGRRLDGKGTPVGEELTLPGVPLPTTEPVVGEDCVLWIGVTPRRSAIEPARAAIYRLGLDEKTWGQTASAGEAEG